MTENTAVELWLLDSVYKLGCPANLQDELRSATYGQSKSRSHGFIATHARSDRDEQIVTTI